MRLTEDPQTDSVLTTPADGSQVRHGRNPDGGYAGPSGGTGTLAHEVDGRALRGTSGTTHHFSPAGLLIPIKGGTGRVRSPARTQEDGGPPTRVTDGLSGRHLDPAWTGDHVTAVTTSPAGARQPRRHQPLHRQQRRSRHPSTDQQVPAHHRSAVESDTTALLSTTTPGATDGSREPSAGRSLEPWTSNRCPGRGGGPPARRRFPSAGTGVRELGDGRGSLPRAPAGQHGSA